MKFCRIYAIASLRERRAANLHEALRQRQSLYGAGDTRDLGGLMFQDAPELDADKFRVATAPDITVLVGWFDSTAERDWMLANGKVILHLGDRRGSLPLIKALAVASHVLLHGREYETVPGLLDILPKAGEVWTRTEVQAAGFGNKDTELALMRLFRLHRITGWRCKPER